MKTGRVYFYLSVFLFILSSTTAFAAGKSVRPCATADLVGTWDMKSINSKIKAGPNDAFVWPYQRFTFDARGGVKQIASVKPLEQDKKSLDRFNNELTTSLYHVDAKGVLTISKLESPTPERCLCAYVVADVPAEVIAKVPEAKRANLPQKGNVALTYVNAKGKPVLVKALKKI